MKALNKDKSMLNMLNINIYSALFPQYISFIIMSNMLNQAQKILLVFTQSNWMYVEHVKHIKACNFLNNGPICNLLALLELSYSALFPQYISFIIILNMSNQVQKILLVFLQSNWMYVEHVKHISLYSTVYKTLINNLWYLIQSFWIKRYFNLTLWFTRYFELSSPKIRITLTLN